MGSSTLVGGAAFWLPRLFGKMLAFLHDWRLRHSFQKSNGSGPIHLARRLFITPILAAMIILTAHVAARAEVINIVALGASNTWGWGVARHHGYPEQLQAMLRERGYDVHLKNAGVVGDTTSGMLRRIHKVVPDGTQIVIFQPGSNDLRFFGTKEQRDKNISAIV